MSKARNTPVCDAAKITRARVKGWITPRVVVDIELAQRLEMDLNAAMDALSVFAAMHREGTDPDEVACERGVASDMTVITSGDFQKARDVLRKINEIGTCSVCRGENMYIVDGLCAYCNNDARALTPAEKEQHATE